MLTGKGKVIFRYRADQKVLEASANRRTSGSLGSDHR